MSLTATHYLAIAAIIVVLALVRAASEGSARVRRFYSLFGALELLAIASLLALLVGLGVVQIVLRNTAHTGILWADPLMRHIVLWLGALGAALATARLRHINIDVLSRLLPQRLLALRRIVVYGATAVASFALGVAALRLVIDERAYGQEAFLEIETWMLQAVLPFAFFLICYRSLVNLFLARETRPATAEVEVET